MLRNYSKKPKSALLRLSIVAMMLLNLGIPPQLATAQPDIFQEQINQVESQQVVLSVAAGTNIDQVAEDFGVEIVRRGPLNYVTVKVAGNKNIQEVIKALKVTPGILSAEENYRRTIESTPSTLPSDPLFREQWSLVKGDVPGAWEMGATGQGVTVAVIDTGVALQHPDLIHNLVPGYNAITGSEVAGANQDNNGHGTGVAGVIAAERNRVGITGVAYQAKIMPVKVMDSKGEGNDDVIADGIIWAAAHGAKIINLSLGSENGSFASDILKKAVAYAADKGCLLIAASGNYDPKSQTNPGVSYPASDPHVLAVTATDKADEVTDYSSTGPEVDLAAPGDSIPTDGWSPTSGSGYVSASGTSMAAPFVAGEAALLWSQHIDWSREQVIQALTQGTQDLGVSGRDDQYGYGLVDAKLALTLANKTPDTVPAPVGINVTGGIVQATSGSTQVSLTIPPQAFDKPVDVTLRTTATPADLSANATFLTPAFQVDLGSETPLKMLSLQFNDPLIGVNSSATLYRWSGSRWISLGGEIISGEARVGLYTSGIYAIGTDKTTETQNNRFAGATAEETAVQISKATFTTGADTVILAQVNQFPDALAGAPLAYKLQAPILLSQSSGLNEEVRTELQRLAPKKIYLLGGTAALSSTIESELRQKYEVKRLYGYSAEGTARAIATELGTKGRAVIASVRQFQDALVISSWAARQGVPILLTESQDLSTDTQTALESLNVTETLVIGGTAVVGSKVMDRLPNPSRISGLTAYDTAAAVLQVYPPTTAKLEVATGENFPDALTGAVRAAFYGTRVVLVPTQTAIPSSLGTLLKTWNGKHIEVFGGTSAVPEDVIQALEIWVE
ncbi:N-acetylmuramoyl-L-alanine amidase [Desulfosporosinus sp. I2]|uniref:S8 family serine peptidase n=1 Tax=Desulfosporosinus sp. I2 TaxID=1617025 RepID=UPI0005EFD968|nr:S8 family serine peptidase [Desulfosporosinus sp. I2]KJR47064.1 N-acetylmuramoyl-L-alanine amidase [Desulfosporosinus sp. I2]